MATVLCLGEALIDFVADDVGVPLRDCSGFRKAAGGAPANVAVGLARLGVSSAFIGKVGDDPFGRFLERSLSESGVDTRGMRYDPRHRTGLAFVSLLPGGEREFTFYRPPSADMLLRPEEIDVAFIEQAEVFHFGSVSLISEPSRTATLWAAGRARRLGKRISYDPNLRLKLWPSVEEARREALNAVRLADILKVSADEAELLSGDESGVELLALGPKVICVTRGAAGCTVVTAAGSRAVPGFPVEAVDTTGAGDGFVAGLLAALHGAPAPLTLDLLESACRQANAVGALTCTRKGAIPALPGPAELAGLLGAGGGEPNATR